MAAPGCVCSKAYVLSFPKSTPPALVTHSEACIEANERALNSQLWEKIRWEHHTGPCPDRGAHKAHGDCPGWAYDRT